MTGSTSGPELEPLMTVCPHCGRRFRVTEAQLQVARGQVRCGGCGEVFDGVDHLVLDTPLSFSSQHDAEQALDALMSELLLEMRAPLAARAEGPVFTVLANPPSAEDAVEPEVGEVGDAGDAGEVGDAGEPEPSGRPLADDPASVAGDSATDSGALSAAPAANAEPAPFAPSSTRVARTHADPAAEPDPLTAAAPNPFSDPALFGAPPPRRPWPLIGGVSLGLIAVAVLVLWVRFEELVRDPAWRPFYAGVCRWTGCTLPVRRDLDRIRTRHLAVESVPDLPGRLRVRAVIANEAAFPQPFPALELRFSALNGTLVAGHRFQPADYLAGDARELDAMPPETPVQLEISVPDPGEVAVNYQLRFR